jgi:hypothetical protein
VTDPEAPAPAWLPVLTKISRASGHEMRNALNALVVNLEVVRTLTPGDAPPAEFVRQAVAQGEESVRLAEAVIGLLDIVTRSLDDAGRLRCELASASSVRLAAGEEVAHRASRLLAPLAERGAVGVDTSGSAVILSLR